MLRSKNFTFMCILLIYLFVVSARANVVQYDRNRVVNCNLTCDWNIDPTNCKFSQECRNVVRTIERKRKESSWRMYYDKVISYIKSAYGENPVNLNIVELGTCWGGNALSLAASFPCCNIIAVDPFLAGYDKQDLQSWVFSKLATEWSLSAEEFSKLYARAMFYDIRMARRHCNYDLIHNYSVPAAVQFADKSVDFLFVDGLHTYDGVVEDITVRL